MTAVMLAVAFGVALGAAGLVAWLVHRSLDARMGTTDAELRRLGDASVWRERGTDDMRREIAAFRQALDEMRAREGERRVREDQGWTTMHRIASVLAGGQAVGRAGENVLRESLAHLPPTMLETDVRESRRP